jgi:hypothetical protein
MGGERTFDGHQPIGEMIRCGLGSLPPSPLSVRYVDWRKLTMPKPDLTPDFEGPISGLLERESKLLELLLGDAGLSSLRARVSNHPAVIEFIAQPGSVRYPDEIDQVLELGGAALDNMTIAAELSPENVLESIGDPEVLRQLRRRVTDPGMFFDQMAAFTCWNLLRDRDITSRLIEKEGQLDILVTLNSGSQEWIECKRIRLGSEPKRLRKVIKKANEQIRRADTGGVGGYTFSLSAPKIGRCWMTCFPTMLRLI